MPRGTPPEEELPIAETFNGRGGERNPPPSSSGRGARGVGAVPDVSGTKRQPAE
ncbi:hypothetical protein [Okeania sp. SIO2B3]|uniref:hypothetical protein n=1 Tax=Okeania sp. SIO2B3 TaxID=2607784 RepID=UPI0013C04BB4|nr:hypothetical protein [Okeania sp. SIO2B3]NET40528.1 hypothetical protein [Okeania sp. SIO2B3]